MIVGISLGVINDAVGLVLGFGHGGFGPGFRIGDHVFRVVSGLADGRVRFVRCVVDKLGGTILGFT